MHILIIIALGIFLPPVALVGIPVRGAYLLHSARPLVKFLMALILLPWAYFVFMILKNGYVSSEGGVTGPTVFPVLWVPLCLVWGAVELLHKRGVKLQSAAAPKSLPADAEL